MCIRGRVTFPQVTLGLSTSGTNRLLLGSPESDRVEEVELHWDLSLSTLPVRFRGRRLPLQKHNDRELQVEVGAEVSLWGTTAFHSSGIVEGPR